MVATDTQAWTVAVIRAATYALCARALAAPRSERLRALAAGLSPLLEDLVTGDSALDDARAQMIARLADPVDGLRAAHVQQFTHVTSPDCPTHETAYSERDVFRQAQQMADIAGFYRAWGFQIGGAERERPDHIGVELEFMALLARKEARAIEEGRAAEQDECRRSQRLFVQDHLGCWGESLGGRIARLATAPYYAALGRLLAEWVRSEIGTLGVTPIRPLDEPLPPPPPDTDDACGLPEGSITAAPDGFVGLAEIGGVR